MEQNIIDAEYQVVKERTPDVIRTEIKTIEAQVYKTTLDGVIQIGARLQELKEMIGHGNWLDWCKENLGYTDRQARRYMEISAEYGDENSAFSNWTMSSNLSISKAYSLLALSEEDVEAFAEKNDIERVTVKELEARIREWKNKAETVEGENEDLRTSVKEADAQRLELIKKIEELEKREVDPEELENLRKQLDKKTEEVKKAKKALKDVKQSQQQAIDAAVAEQKERIQKEAEEAQVEKQKKIEAEQTERLRESEEYRRAAENRAADLEKKLEQAANEDITLFKVKTDQLQNDFVELEQTIANIAGKDPEQAEKMKTALKTVMCGLANRLED
ncbi:DUF3102 domain-containing protein [bacterium 210820-DFI.6.37]|nr:DUF3102 domain-containing protein [bacterium 210820-DFI.6.37]